jgi:hypothetical protein
MSWMRPSTPIINVAYKLLIIVVPSQSQNLAAYPRWLQHISEHVVSIHGKGAVAWSRAAAYRSHLCSYLWQWECYNQSPRLPLLSTSCATKSTRFQPEPIAIAKVVCSPAHQEPLLDNFISAIAWVQWVIFPCYEEYAWLIVDMSSWHCRRPKVWHISARAKPKPRLFEASTPKKQLLTISFPPYGPNEWCYHVMKALYGWFWTCQVFLALSLAKVWHISASEPSQNKGCL